MVADYVNSEIFHLKKGLGKALYTSVHDESTKVLPRISKFGLNIDPPVSLPRLSV